MISVVIPFYNRADTIVDSVESVLMQSFKPNEIILVDDGSTDGGRELVSKKFGDSIRILSTGGRRGACYARNLGLKSAKFDFVAFQDSDDIWFRDKLEKQMDLLHSTGSDMCFSSFVKESSGKRVICPRSNDVMPSVGEGSVIDNQKAIKSAYRRNHLSTQTLVLRKSRVDVLFDEQLPRFQDWDFYLSCLYKGLRICYLNQPTALVRVQEDSITKNFEAGIEARKIIRRKYCGKVPGVKEKIFFDFDILLRRYFWAYVNFKKRF